MTSSRSSTPHPRRGPAPRPPVAVGPNPDRPMPGDTFAPRIAEDPQRATRIGRPEPELDTALQMSRNEASAHGPLPRATPAGAPGAPQRSGSGARPLPGH